MEAPHVPTVNPLEKPIEIDSVIQELKDLIFDTQFQNDFLAVRTKLERKSMLKIKKKDPAYSRKISELQEALQEKVRINIEDLDRLKKDLEHPSAVLVEALHDWGRTRNVRGDIGPEQKGHNAGVIHYFQYRGHARKNRGHFKDEHLMSVEGFIDYTKYYKSFLDNCDPKNNPQIASTRLLEDSKGNRRLYIITKDNDFIVGFQRKGQEMKILSVYFTQNLEKFNATVNLELQSETQAVGRFNRLEGAVKEIPIDLL